MKKSEIFFSSILVPIDYLLLIAAGASAYGLRYSKFYQEQVREVVFSLNFAQYFKYLCLIAAIWIVIFFASGLFSMKPSKKVFDLLTKIFLACSTGALAVLVIFFFSRELFTSRFIILAAWILSVIYISAAHLTARLCQRLLYKKGIGVHKAALIGQDGIGRELEREFGRNQKLGYQAVLRADGVQAEAINQIKSLAKQDKIDEIIQTDPNMSREDNLFLMELASEYHLDFKYAADLLGARRANFDIKTINGIPLIEIKKTPLDGWGRVVKRIVDMVGSFLCLIIGLPLFLAIAVLIKLDANGPIIYRQIRVGARGRKFYISKFRSMVAGADQMKEQLKLKNERADGPLFKITDDPRVTRIGRYLRRTSLDELPNFWNVLIGHMSLVGPRPHLPDEVARYEKHHKKLLNIKPGITGLAQVSGRSGLDFETEVKLDTLYIETWSLKQDLIILVKTPWIVLFGRNAV